MVNKDVYIKQLRTSVTIYLVSIVSRALILLKTWCYISRLLTYLLTYSVTV